VLGIDAEGTIRTDGLIANPVSGASHGYQLKLDARGRYAVAGTFATGTSFWSSVGFGDGLPAGGADLSVTSALSKPGALSLFLARVDAESVFDWAVQAGGDGSGMTTAPWNLALAAHPSHSATVAGIFNASAIFGDQVTETLQSPSDGVGSAFVARLNSEAEYDYCK
jgi:hypothetical protein